MRVRWLPAVAMMLAVGGCNGGVSPALPTAPGMTDAAGNSTSSTAATYVVAGSIFTFGGRPPTQIAVSAPGGPTVGLDDQGRFELSGVPTQAGFLLLRIDGRDMRLALSPPGRGQALVLEIRVDLGAGRAEVTRRCAVSAPPSGQMLPAAAVTALCLG